MEYRGGTSIEELMRTSNNSNMSEDESIVNSILNETANEMANIIWSKNYRRMKR